MIYVQRDRDNTYIARLEDNRMDYTTHILWVVTHKGTGLTYAYIMDDTSPRPSSYNMYTLVQDSTAPTKTSYINEPVNLPSGEYTYVAYETEHLDTDISLSYGVELTTGIMVVEDNVLPAGVGMPSVYDNVSIYDDI